MAPVKDHWVYKLLFILVCMAVIIYGAAGGAAVIRYSNDVKGNCTVTSYEEDINKIRVRVHIGCTVSRREIELGNHGRGKWKCKHHDQEQYAECAGALMGDYPVGSTDVCWYDKDNYNDETYLMYWERRRVEHFWKIFGALLAVLVVLVAVKFIPDDEKNPYSPV